MSRTPLLTALIAVAAIAAAPISLHFEGNEGTAEPFVYVLPLAALVAGAGLLIGLRGRARWLSLANAFAGALAVIFWIALVTYEGR
jgi:hypothetical protein